MKKHLLYLLLTCLTLISCSVWEQPPPPTLEPSLYEPEGLGTPPSYIGSVDDWTYLGSGIIYTKKGLTQAGKAQLERQQTTYFFMDFATIPSETLIQALEISGVEILRQLDTHITARIKPSALTFLQRLSEDNVLKFAGPIPPRLKTKDNELEIMQNKASFYRFKVNVTLLTKPTEKEREEIAYWLDIKEEQILKTRPPTEMDFQHKSYFQVSTYQLIGYIKVKNVPALLDLPIVFGLYRPIYTVN